MARNLANQLRILMVSLKQVQHEFRIDRVLQRGSVDKVAPSIEGEQRASRITGLKEDLASGVDFCCCLSSIQCPEELDLRESCQSSRYHAIDVPYLWPI